MNAYEEYCDLMVDALAAVAAVVEHPEHSKYEPFRAALAGALYWLELEMTCGDCVEGRCHWGGERSRESIALAEAGGDEDCGCARHEISVETRRRQARLEAAH